MVDFIHTHVHSHYSVGDGIMSPVDICQKVYHSGMKACALTDHGTMHGIPNFAKYGQEWGIKTIFGMEAYICQDVKRHDDDLFHLVLLAKDKTGYHNLIKLASDSNLKYFYKKPRIDKKILSQYSEGLIALSGCIKGEIPSHIIHNNMDLAKKSLMEYLKIFPDFYLEVQNNKLDEQKKANNGILELANDMAVPIVVTCDCHFLNNFDVDRFVLNSNMHQDEEYINKEGISELYIKSPDQVKYEFSWCTEGIDHSTEIALMCEEIDITPKRHVFPACIILQGTDENFLLKRLAEDGLKDKFSHIPRNIHESYISRLLCELEVIKEMKFSRYFLAVHDIVSECKKRNIRVGAGRGSAVGSLVLYALGVTKIDPIKYDLLFERFLNTERVSLPDIDIDIESGRRSELIEYLRNNYGQEKVARIINFTTRKARSSVRDAGKMLGMEAQLVDQICKAIPDDVPIIKALEESKQLKQLYDEDLMVQAMLHEAMQLETIIRHLGVHASGIIISDNPIEEFCPLCIPKRTENDDITTQYDGTMLEGLGIPKFDLLGLKTCDIFSTCLRNIEENGSTSLDLDAISLNDSKTLRLFQSGYTECVFQMEGSAKEILRRIKPDCFEDIVVVNALNRPGPRDSGMVDSFIRRKLGEEPISYFGLDDILKPILKTTYGNIIYQEQVMQIAVAIADYTLANADLLRRAMGKKDKAEMLRHKKIFIEKAVKKGIEAEKANKIFTIMEKFAEYGFNKSHSAAYALLSWQSAYLKAHFPVEYMAAVLANEDKLPKRSDILRTCKNMGIDIQQPDINSSPAFFTPLHTKIMFGLSAIKTVSKNATKEILEKRADGYSSFYDFCSRINKSIVRKNTIESLIKAGAFDCFGTSRQILLEDLEKILGAIKNKKEYPLLISSSTDSLDKIVAWETEVLGYSGRTIFGNFDYEAKGCIKLEEFTQLSSNVTAACPVFVEGVKEYKDKNGLPYAVLRVRDDEAHAEIRIFYKALPKNDDGTISHKTYAHGKCILARCSVNTWGNANGEIRLLARSISEINEKSK